MTRNLLRTMAASASVLPGAAMALGLGPIDVKTVLDQPLEAHIPIVSARSGELKGVTANLASRELFTRMGLERPSLLRQLDFTVEGLDSETPYIRVTSKTPIREPSINILLEISWASGRMLRDFSVLLDPPLSVRRAPKTRTVAVAPSTGSRVSLPSSSRSASAPGFNGAAYGPVASGETLWSIAELMRPDRSISVSQMMLALLHTNPDAFYKANVNSLNAGVMLRMPGRDELAALSRGEAKTEVDRQHAAIGASWAPTTRTVDSGPSENVEMASAPRSSTIADADLGVDPGAGLGQIRLVDADDTSAATVTGDAAGATTTASGHGPLIQLESGGVALQLVGLEGLAERMPTVIGVHDVAMATEIVSEKVEDRLPIAEESYPGEENTSAALAESDMDMDFAADVTEPSGVSEDTALSDAGVEFGSDAIAAAQAFRTQAGIPSMAGTAGDTVAAELSPPSDRLEVGPDGLTSTADAISPTLDEHGLVAGTSTDDLLDFQSATISPLENETFDLVSDTSSMDPEGQSTAANENVGTDYPLLPSEGIDTGEPLEQVTMFDQEPAELFFDESVTAMAPLDSESNATGFQSGTGAFLSPKSIATYGGGVLAVLLLMLALIRRSLGGKEAEPEALVQNDAEEPVELSETDWSEPVADSEETTAETDTTEVDAEETPIHEEEVDPAAKADVLIAMGEHAQAIDLLENALQQAPDNAHVALKILQTHVSVENGDAFADFAASHRELLQGSGLWPQVVAMGTALCPQHELFGGTTDAEEALEESTSPPENAGMATQVLPSVPSMLGEPVAETLQDDDAELQSEDSSADILEFKLPEEEDTQADRVAEESQIESAHEDDLDLGLDFDLEEFSLDASNRQDDGIEEDTSDAASTLEAPLAVEFESPLDEIAAGAEAFGDDATLKVESVPDLADDAINPTLKVAAVSDFSDLKFDASDQEETEFDLDREDEDVSALSSPSDTNTKDEDTFVDTKLDLATAYLEMGDSDGARSLYEEVVEEGNQMQRKVAEDALAKMG